MNTSRRQFLRQTSGAVLTAAALPAFFGVGCGTTGAQEHSKRKIKKAIMYGTIGYKGTIVEKFKAMKAAGFEGVEPMSHMKQDEVVAALQESGLKAASVCCSTHWNKDMTLSHPDAAARAKGLEGLKQSLRDAKRYGAPSVLLVPGVVNKEAPFAEAWKRSIGEIRKAIPLCEELGVKIAVENVWNNFIMKPEQARDFVDEINSKWVGWHFDIGNMVQYAPSEEWINVLGKRIINLHFKEYSLTKGFGVMFHEGDNHWPAIMAALDKVGYKGWGITEMPGNQTRDEASLKEFMSRLDRAIAS